MGFLKPKTSTQSTVSQNTNNSLITGAYGGQIGQGTAATVDLSHMLGVGDPNGYANYLQQAGYAPAMRQLSQGITGQGAAAGILNSGTTARALQSRGTEINQGFFNNYLQQLQGLSGLGLQAGGLVANTGQRSDQQSQGGGPSTLGSIGSAIGGLASVGKTFGIFSDRRLKTDVRKVGELNDGLGVYLYRYIGHAVEQVGVMADEVAKLRPWALGRKVAGYQTVNYGAL